MKLEKAFIPYRGYYSTPFSRWQGTLQNEHAIELGASTAKRWLESKGWDPKMFDYLFLGMTIGQKQWFYGSTWAAALMGADHIPGMTISQACTTSTTCIWMAALGIETGMFKLPFCLMTDRCSNGPHIVWPNPLGPGGEVISENWMMDNFNRDPWGGMAMVQTAEAVAKEIGFTREESDELVLLRYNQYLMALENDRAFQKRYMFPAIGRISKKETKVLEQDEGVIPTTREGLKNVRVPVPGGVISFAAQTFPADGNCGIIVTTREKAKELSADPNIEIQIISYGYARAEKARMPKAPVPAAQMALENAGLKIDDIAVIKMHEPFTVNTYYFAKQFGIKLDRINNYGSSLIYGHPQGPTAGRLIIEGIEEAVLKGGGYVLFSGCAAGDTAASLILKVG